MNIGQLYDHINRADKRLHRRYPWFWLIEVIAIPATMFLIVSAITQ